MTDYDSPWKEALDVYFQPFMEFFFALAHAEIDWSRGYESLDKELQQIVREGELGRRLVDKLVKVWLLDGAEQWLLIHVEVQTTEEADFARRMYIYNNRLFDRYNREVVSLAVLGDDNPRWKPDRFGYSRWGFQTEIKFPTAKLLDHAKAWEELESSRNPFATIVSAHLRTLQTRQHNDQRQASKIRLIKGLYDRGLCADDVRQLFRLIDWMMDLPEPLQAGVWEKVREYEKEKHMPFITYPERVGRQEGLAQGLSQGRSEGLAEGLEVALELKFGAEGLKLMPEIRSISDHAKLEKVLHAVRDAKTPADLRRLWAP